MFVFSGLSMLTCQLGLFRGLFLLAMTAREHLPLLWPQELSLNPGLCLSPELELSVPDPKDLQLQPGPCPAPLSLLQRKEEVMHTYMSKFTTGWVLILVVFPCTVTPTVPTTVDLADNVRFLGLDLTSHSAEIALYVLFALSGVGALGLALLAYKYGTLSKKSRKQSPMELSKM